MSVYECDSVWFFDLGWNQNYPKYTTWGVLAGSDLYILCICLFAFLVWNCHCEVWLFVLGRKGREKKHCMAGTWLMAVGVGGLPLFWILESAWHVII